MLWWKGNRSFPHASKAMHKSPFPLPLSPAEEAQEGAGWAGGWTGLPLGAVVGQNKCLAQTNTLFISKKKKKKKGKENPFLGHHSSLPYCQSRLNLCVSLGGRLWLPPSDTRTVSSLSVPWPGPLRFLPLASFSLPGQPTKVAFMGLSRERLGSESRGVCSGLLR